MHDDISMLLDKLKVALRVGHHCAQPIMKKLGIKGTIRVNLAFYNDFEDIDKAYCCTKKSIKYVEGLKNEYIEKRLENIKEDLDFLMKSWQNMNILLI